MNALLLVQLIAQSNRSTTRIKLWNKLSGCSLSQLILLN